jgi:phytoene synthase
MKFQTARAREFYARAVTTLPVADRRALTAAEIMRGVYSRLLARMEGDGYQVFIQRYSLSRLEKLAIIAGEVIRAKFA